MIRKVLLGLALMLCQAHSHAQTVADAIYVGYCEGSVSTQGAAAFTTDEENTWVSQAIYLPDEILRQYQGNDISKIKVALGAVSNVDTIQVWVRTSLDGENLTQGVIYRTQTTPFQKGWNEICFDTPWAIASGQGLYVGYSFFQEQKTKALAIQSPEDVEPREHALYVKLGENALWEDRHIEGTAPIQAVITGNNLPQCDLMLMEIEIPELYVIQHGIFEVNATIKNIGAATISACEIECRFDSMETTYAAEVELNLSYGQEKTISFIIFPDCFSVADDQIHTVEIKAARTAEGEDADLSNNILNGEFNIIDRAFYRKVLLEEFTTEQCANCPSMAYRLQNLLADEKYAQRVAMICHHSGFYTDWLTSLSDTEYLWFYNQESTYAPALMIDRQTTSDTASPVFFSSDDEAMRAKLDRRLKEWALVSVNLSAQLSVDKNTVEVRVTGQRTLPTFTNQAPRLTVSLLEDSVKARNQKGTIEDFYHNHVVRANNSAWGEEMEWDGDMYEYECILPIESDCKYENLSLIAYVWDFDPSDPTECQISNCSTLPYQDFEATGAVYEIPFSRQDQKAEYYSIEGYRICEPRKGVNIIRYTDGNSRLILIK